VQVPNEIGRWKLAAALKLRDDGEKAAAYDKLEVAMLWFPDSPSLLIQRAEWRLADGEREAALADCDQALEAGGNRLFWLQVHAQFMWDAGEFARAADDWKQINALSERTGKPSREMALNGLAYAQALAKVDLEDALQHADEALRLEPGNEAILDTRGYILHLQDRNEEAVDDLNAAVKGMDANLAAVRKALFSKRGAASAEPISAEPKAIQQVKREHGELGSTRAEILASAARSAAVGHYHRALALAALERTEEANEDLAIARQLIGREPDETLF
jgi:tetratricopeptide (TPR) repeat protein